MFRDSLSAAGIAWIGLAPSLPQPATAATLWWLDRNGDGFATAEEFTIGPLPPSARAIQVERSGDTLIFARGEIGLLSGEVLQSAAVGLPFIGPGYTFGASSVDRALDLYADGVKTGVLVVAEPERRLNQVIDATLPHTVLGSLAADRIINAGERLVAFGNEGNDTLRGGNGNDLLHGGAGLDILFGGAGDDYVVAEATEVLGGRARGDSGMDLLYLTSGGPAEIVLAQYGFEAATGSEGDNRLSAGLTSGPLTIFGAGGADTLTGGNGNDVLTGGADADHLLGGSGNDILVADAADTVIDGGAGIDSLLLSGPVGAVVDLFTASVEIVFGGEGNDYLDGSAVLTQLSINGGGGADTLKAGTGDDLLEGGAGNDSVHGGAGFDVAFYGGAAAGYEVMEIAPGRWRVRDVDISDGDDGTDTVEGIERLALSNSGTS